MLSLLSLASLVAHYCREVTGSIATPPGWDASPLQVTPSISGGELEALYVGVKCLAQETKQTCNP